MSKKTNIIYSIQTELYQSGLVEIETVILKGLYRFSILGINQKYGSDMKDRVYSALRSEKLLNLKSDNRKITVNLLPTNIEKKSTVYDLGIALACMVQTSQLEIHENIIAIGELSISGNVIESCKVLQAIFQAIKNNIKIIICSEKDMFLLYNSFIEIDEIIKNNGINFIVGKNLSEIVHNIKNKIYYVHNHKKQILTKNDVLQKDLSEQEALCVKNILKEKSLFKIIIALSTNKSVFIENNNQSNIKRFIKNLIYYNVKLSKEMILHMADVLKSDDIDILQKFIYPHIAIIDKNTPKEELLITIHKSIYGFIILEQFTDIPEDYFYTIKKYRTSPMVSFYNPCPCGNNGLFFTSIYDEKCLCLQRTILRHKQKIKNLEQGYFDFHISNTTLEKIEYEYSPDVYIYINKIIKKIKSTEFTYIWHRDAIDYISKIKTKYENTVIDTIIQVSEDVCKIRLIDKQQNTESLFVLLEDIQKAEDIIKKDF